VNVDEILMVFPLWTQARNCGMTIAGDVGTSKYFWLKLQGAGIFSINGCRDQRIFCTTTLQDVHCLEELYQVHVGGRFGVGAPSRL
jgi:hypothetical protein